MTEEEAARFVRAALDLMINRVPNVEGLTRVLLDARDALYVEYPASRWQKISAPEPTTEPAPLGWFQVVEGDWVQGADGKWYPVTATSHANGNDLHVTIRVNGRENTYPRDGRVETMVKRGATGLAMDTIRSAGFDVSVIASS